jgi:NDP-sugar pyrophosphorylase family protein/lipopolysaccharide/colanic/teichoic acid biosynthesis glycosyltransferase
MKAIVIATGLSAGIAALRERYPAPLLPLVDRPFIQHVVETLVDRDITEFDFILSHLPEKLEHLLGSGARWGSRIRFHLARDAARPYASIKRLCAESPDNPVLLVHGDRLPQLPEDFGIQTSQGSANLLYCLAGLHEAPPEKRWTGWAWLGEQFRSMREERAWEEMDEAALFRALAPDQGDDRIVEVPRALSVQTYEDLLAAQSAVLLKAFPGLMLTGHEVEPGIWISRNVSLHPSAKLTAPVYLGENCRIGADITLGPNATVANNSLIDSDCIVSNSIIFPGSYVGESLELREALVDKNLLVNVRLGAAVPITDDFILGSLSENHFRAGFSRIVSRTAAIVLLALLWPVLAITALWLRLIRSGPVLSKRELIKLPAPAVDSQWKTYQLWSFQQEPSEGRPATTPAGQMFFHFLPGLVNVARGEIRFVGVRPRTRSELKRLPHDWQSLVLHSKAGLITEAEALYGAHPDDDELYSAEAFYSATASLRHDFKILCSYLRRLFGPAVVERAERERWTTESEA